MGKKLKIKPSNVDYQSSRIKATGVNDTAKVSFSFKRLCQKSDKFVYDNRQSPYFLKLLERLRDVSKMTRVEMKQSGTLRCHPIDFINDNVSESSFGILGSDDRCDDAWQFSLTSNEHGRVHGYFIDNTFYVVWLDPDHKLYRD